MHRLSLLIVVALCSVSLYGQSPHGDQLSIDCAKCHTSDSWYVNPQSMSFDHSDTNFDLDGVHKLTDCASCHQTLVFENTPSGCISCHKDIHEQSVGNDCVRCHTSDNWLVFNIPEIHESNGFSLVGNHANLSCSECHTNGNELQITPIGNECINCHTDTYIATTNPNHLASGFSKDCTQCHDASKIGWNLTDIDHSFFPLTQGHEISDCTQCHDMNNLSNISADCVSCHQSNFDATQLPKHSAAAFSTNCATCHTTAVGWKPTSFSHDFFPLQQGHAIDDCTQCHTQDNYTQLSAECVDCHLDTFNATTNPNHTAANYPTSCATCHTTAVGWTPSTFNHDFFPLTQAHDIADCTACHTNNNFTNLSADCVSCHQDQYTATTNPNHTAAGYPTNCAVCHTTNPGWVPATVNHDFFPLTSGHNIADCTACHVNNNYANLSTECVDCHQANYNATTNPNHTAANYPTDCTQCHTTSPGWTPATVNHDFFPLTQGHNISDCSACHVNNNYTTLSSDCVECHLTNYNTATEPNHSAASFPLSCASCHTTAPGWTPATFDHDSQYFPIYSGKHRGEWSSCTDCHKEPTNYASFSCFDCHLQNKMNEEHRGVNGYVYDSNACFTCHPNPD